MLPRIFRTTVFGVLVLCVVASVSAPVAAAGKIKLTETEKIRKLLYTIEKSPFRFKIDGKVLFGFEAKERLEEKWDHRTVRKAEEFISSIADKSALTGTENKVILQSGSIPISEYLNNELDLLNKRCITVEDRDLVGESSFKFFPFVHIEKNYERQEYSFLWPIFSNRQDLRKGTTDSWFAPIYDYHEDKIKELWRFDLFGVQRVFKIPSLASFGKNKDTWHAYFFPFFYWEKDYAEDSVDTNVLWPIFQYDRRGDWYSRTSIWPFITVAEDARDNTSYVGSFWPLFSCWTERAKSHSHLFPLYSYDADLAKGSSEYHFLWLLSGFYSDNESSSNYVFPLTWWGGDKNRDYSVFLAGLTWYDHNRKKDETYFHFLPFYLGQGRGNDKSPDRKYWHMLLPPLAHWGYDRKADYSRFDILFPLFGHKREKTFSSTWAFPFLYTCADTEIEDPYAFTWVAPTFFSYSHKEDYYFQFFPFYSYSSKREPGVAEPYKAEHSFLYFLFNAEYDEKKDHSSVGLLWPLFYHEYEKGVSSGHFFPLAWWENDRRTGTGYTTIFPLFYRSWSPDYDRLVIFPFVFSTSGADSERDSSVFVFNLFGTQKWEDEELGLCSQTSFLYPFFTFTTESKGRYAHTRLFWPLFEYERNDFTKVSWASALLFLYSYQDDPAYYQHTFFPFYSYVYDKKEKASDYWVLWPLISGKSNPVGYDFSILWELFRNRYLAGEYYEVRCNPFFQYYEEYPKGEPDVSCFSLFWGLARYWEQGNKHSFRILYELYKNKRSRERYDHNLQPLWMYSYDMKDRQESLDLLYILFNYRGDDNKKTYAYRLLGRLWLCQQTEKKFIHEFNPIWQYQSGKHEPGTENERDWMSLSFLWFVMRYYEDGNDYTFRVLWRLFYLKENDDYYAFEFHPFFMYSDGRDEGTRFHLLYYLWDNHKRVDKKTGKFIDSHYQVLGGLFGIEHEGDETYVRLFWGLRL